MNPYTGCRFDPPTWMRAPHLPQPRTHVVGLGAICGCVRV
jgi:hypothetical protein